MTDIVADGQPFEASPELAAERFASTPPSFTSAFGALFSRDSTVAQTPDSALKGQYVGATPSERYMTVTGLAGAGLPVPAPIETPELPADEVNKRYAPEGTKITDKPMREGIAQIVGKEKSDAMERDAIIQRYEAQHSWIWNFGVGTAAFMLDPVNAATAFIPGAGEEAIAARLGGGILARTAGRAVAGATGAIAGQIPLQAARYALDPEEASDMSARDVMRELLYTAAGGAILQAGIGGVAERFRRPAEAKAPAAEAPPPAPPVDAAKAIDQSSAEVKWSAMRSAISQIMDGREIDVMPVIDADAVRSMSQEAELRNEHADLTAKLQAIPQRPEEAAAAEKLTRLEAVERNLADENITPEERRAQMARRDEILTDTTPEKLRAQAGPLEERRQLQNQISSIEAQLQAADNKRAAATLGRIIPSDDNALAQRLMDLPAAQRQMYRNGFAQGVPQPEFDATYEAVYGTKAEEVEGEAEPPKPPTEAAPPKPPSAAGGAPAEVAKPTTPEEKEAADLEVQWQRANEAAPIRMTDEQRTEIQSAIDEYKAAQAKTDGYTQAASCLDGSGV